MKIFVLQAAIDLEGTPVLNLTKQHAGSRDLYISFLRFQGF